MRIPSSRRRAMSPSPPTSSAISPQTSCRFIRKIWRGQRGGTRVAGAAGRKRKVGVENVRAGTCPDRSSDCRWKYKDNWESLSTYPVPQWYREAKFGAFIHWGAYTVPAYFSEWYVRLMYYHQNPVYWHHNRKYGKDYPYRKFIEQFTAPNFDAGKSFRS